ncbi:MAG: hypothetical protein BRD38_02370 [Bacteroidetes bacterium QH_9_67_14]|nr:MAG: hypothetical protein BRD38_02370 [Bacteroidetes bacterium QH_9_67_14]
MSDVQPRSSAPATRSARSDADVNYTKEAFQNSWNQVFLVTALSLIAVMALVSEGLPVGLVAMGVAACEALYLTVVPRQERFRRAVRSRKLAERDREQHVASQKERYRQLSRRGQRRYARLRQLEDAIEANYEKLSDASQELLQSHLQKLDGLLEAHLNLLHHRERYREYAQATTESEVRRSIEAVREKLEEASPRVRKVQERRLRILKQRLHRFREDDENRDLIEAQLQTIEDTVRYIHEQSWTLQDPDQVTRQLDALLGEVEDTRRSVEEIEEVFTRSPDALLDDLEEQEQEVPPPRRSSARSRRRE